MSLPNYSPSGTIWFGSVPWDNSYTNVRLYSSLEEQQTEITDLMRISSDNYAYIGRNRRIKVSIEADRLYHMNYCMYRNASLSNQVIYCFITDVIYINDNTTEIEIETDVFQTYLYGVDWSIPPCFIERMTAPSESDNYLLTAEPNFTLAYQTTAQSDKYFELGGVVIFTAAKPERADELIELFLNPNGWYAKPEVAHFYKGTLAGCGCYYVPAFNVSGEPTDGFIRTFLKNLQEAGAIESVVAIISVPNFLDLPTINGFVDNEKLQDSASEYQTTLTIPGKGNAVDGYVPRNQKLLYYPYTFCKLTDFNGSSSELRYEFLGNNTVDIKYTLNPNCQALAFPDSYCGVSPNIDAGLTVSCGAQGSWCSNQFQTWLAQNGLALAMTTVAGVALAGVTGGTSLAATAATLSAARSEAKIAGATHATSGARRQARAQYAELIDQSVDTTAGAYGKMAAVGIGTPAMAVAGQYKQPELTKGQASPDIMWQNGTQGVHAQRVQVVHQIAQQIDQFFDRWGYAIERIEAVNITSRETWNYVKTGGAAARSADDNAGTTAPFNRGYGTPAAALALINSCFDRGITFWHNIPNFGDYSHSNAIVTE